MKLASFSTQTRHYGQQRQPEPALAAVPAVPTRTQASTFDFRTVTWEPDGFGFDATSGEFFTASPTGLNAPPWQ